MAISIDASRDGKPVGRRSIPEGRRIVIGRGEQAEWKIEGDPNLSRRHAEVWAGGAGLMVKRLPESSNPVFHGGRAQDEFEVESGGFFVIGRTSFQVRQEDGPREPGAPSIEETIGTAELYSIGSSSDRMRLLDLLELPDILRTKERGDFLLHIAGVIRMATGASWACAASEDGTVLGEDASSDTAARPAMSRTLMNKALAGSPQPTLYSWTKAQDFEATAQEGVDWAVCAAARIPGEPAIVFYALGSGVGSSGAHREGARFVGLVADMVSRSVSNDRLQEWQGRLRRFFSGPVIEKILASSDAAALEPRLARSTVLFFDIRGFSKRTEEKNERILAYVRELRDAMTAMTRVILDEKGVVLQYMGDGIMACWNVPYDDPDHEDRACRAALAMTAEIGRATGGWTCGIGMHTGEVVAGAIGSEQVFSYGILGSVVNQASRVEGLTKLLGVPILATADVIGRVSGETALKRRVGRFVPAGMDAPLELYALCEPGPAPDWHAIFASALAAFERGEWDRTLELVGSLPVQDGPAQFLASQAIQNRRYPPLDWRGVMRLTQK
ncbi:MAG: adenylate/guanylate cyclase domain-containing protein [Elusimicrobia bacterium]|nr:adenylate/guanylate cyclase domain-containing protein [Elusimicrobiota bacterium]